ncbi:MAG: acyl-CoA dehydrogenase family protein [Gemmobacter sp.]
MTEPVTGSDLQGIRTTARRDGDQWAYDGPKTIISSGRHADLAIVVTRTAEGRGSGSHRRFSGDPAPDGRSQDRPHLRLGLCGAVHPAPRARRARHLRGVDGQAVVQRHARPRGRWLVCGSKAATASCADTGSAAFTPMPGYSASMAARPRSCAN